MPNSQHFPLGTFKAWSNSLFTIFSRKIFNLLLENQGKKQEPYFPRQGFHLQMSFLLPVACNPWTPFGNESYLVQETQDGFQIHQLLTDLYNLYLLAKNHLFQRLYKPKNGWTIDGEMLNITNTVFIEIYRAVTIRWVCQWLHVLSIRFLNLLNQLLIHGHNCKS